MHDIKFIRNNPEEFEKLMRRRGLNIKSSLILEIDSSIRAVSYTHLRAHETG